MVPSASSMPSVLDGAGADPGRSGLGVEGDDVGGAGGDQQGVESGGLVGFPGGERLVEELVPCSGSDPVVGGVELDALGAAVADREGGLCFVGVVEAVQVGELDGVGVVGEEAQGAAGLDRGELGGVAEEPDQGTAVAGIAGEPVEVAGAGHAGFVDEDQVAGLELEPLIDLGLAALWVRWCGCGGTCAGSRCGSRARRAGRRLRRRTGRAGSPGGRWCARPG